MQISIQINDKIYRIDSDKFYDLSIPLNFNGAQPNAYDADRAVSKAVEAGALVGDTRRGGSCNFEQYTFIPHCNGTHTESIGHITGERISILDSLKDVFIPAMMISVGPENASESADTYTPEKNAEDRLITRRVIEAALGRLPADAGSSDKKALPANADSSDMRALPADAGATDRTPPEGGTQNVDGLIIRTLPNDDGKLTREYMQKPPPFFSTEAMQYIVESGVKHLLVDMPSIDRMFDEGRLSNHRIFWNIEMGSFEINAESRIHNTVTEMIYVPREVKDGLYLLNLQIAPFAADAAPSRPVIFELE